MQQLGRYGASPASAHIAVIVTVMTSPTVATLDTEHSADELDGTAVTVHEPLLERRLAL